MCLVEDHSTVHTRKATVFPYSPHTWKHGYSTTVGLRFSTHMESISCIRWAIQNTHGDHGTARSHRCGLKGLPPLECAPEPVVDHLSLRREGFDYRPHDADEHGKPRRRHAPQYIALRLWQIRICARTRRLKWTTCTTWDARRLRLAARRLLTPTRPAVSKCPWDEASAEAFWAPPSRQHCPPRPPVHYLPAQPMMSRDPRLFRQTRPGSACTRSQIRLCPACSAGGELP